MASIVSLVIRGISILAGFAITWFIGHTMGPAANGQYALVTQTALFLSIVGLLGIDVAVVRHFSATVTSGILLNRMTMFRVAAIAMALMAIIALALWAGAGFFWHRLFGNVVPLTMMPVVCILLVGRGGSRLFGAILRSQHAFKLGQVIDVALIPTIVALIVAVGLLHTVQQVLWVTALTAVGATIIGLFATLRHTAPGKATLQLPLRTILASSLPLWGSGIFANIGDWYGLFVAAKMLGAHETGLFRVAAQAAAIMQIVSLSLMSVYMPRISAASHSGDKAWLGRLTHSATRLSMVCGVPIAAILLIFAEPLLGLIGPEFVVSASVLRVLVIGQLAFTITGPGGIALAMTGHERLNLLITTASVVLLFVIVPMATHTLGLVGLAASMSALMVARNLTAFVLVWKVVGVNVMTGRVRDLTEVKPE
jgi:O-antigen/teichoic acid export membrane protein